MWYEKDHLLVAGVTERERESFGLIVKPSIYRFKYWFEIFMKDLILVKFPTLLETVKNSPFQSDAIKFNLLMDVCLKHSKMTVNCLERSPIKNAANCWTITAECSIWVIAPDRESDAILQTQHCTTISLIGNICGSFTANRTVMTAIIARWADRIGGIPINNKSHWAHSIYVIYTIPVRIYRTQSCNWNGRFE